MGFENVVKPQADYYDDESNANTEEKKLNLLSLIKKDLSCPQEYREQFDHPSTREFTGFDLSHWIRSDVSRTQHSRRILILALITPFFRYTFVAFLR